MTRAPHVDEPSVEHPTADRTRREPSAVIAAPASGFTVRVRRILFWWGGALVVAGIVYAIVGRGWSYVAIGVGALTVLLALRARPDEPWRNLVRRALALVALGMTAAGVVMRADVWIASGMLGLVVVVVGALVENAVREWSSRA